VTATDRPEDHLDEAWEKPADAMAQEIAPRARRKRFNASPLAQKIITFNLVALILMVAGILYVNPARDSLVSQREQMMLAQAQITSEILTLRTQDLTQDETTAEKVISDIFELPIRESIFVFDAEAALIGASEDRANDAAADTGSTVFLDFLVNVWSFMSASKDNTAAPEGDNAMLLEELVPTVISSGTQMGARFTQAEETVYAVVTPYFDEQEVVAGAVALVTIDGEINALVRAERETILQVFLIALLVSVGLSLVLASTIANPLSDLAAAAEVGRDRNTRKVAPGRVRIPDLTGRPDEIGRLSGALRGMVSALYERIDSNEQFAADVAHEIKNPLASLRSAVGSLRLVKREDHREKLLDVIDHDVRRLDRLVSDISNASRLDSELVKDEERAFDLVNTLADLSEHFAKTAHEKGVDFISDMPDRAIHINGLEARLAQVFVNLISNALSFCDHGDAIRVWVRKRETRVLVVVEDTGPGIPDQALTKIFKRFYSERPESQFGNNSGLREHPAD